MTTPSRAAETPDALTPHPRRLMGWLGASNLSVYLVFGSVPGVLLALQVSDLDPEAKAANLALVTSIGAIVALVMQPVWGVVSDRTRSRYGRRAPYIVGGAALTGLSLVALGAANTLVALVLGWAAVQLSVNMILGPLHAVLPDRLPNKVLGIASSIVGLGLLAGSLGGQILAARMSSSIPAAYLLLAGVVLLVLVAFAVFNPDRPNRDAPREPFRLGAFLRGFWINPLRHPDFFWVFTGRVVLFLGYYAISNYQLYILSDYVGLGDDAVSVVPILSFTSLGATLVATLVSGPLSDRVGRRKVFVIGASVLMGLGMCIPFFLPSVTGMIAMAAVNGFGFGAYLAVDLALFTEVLPARKDAGKDLGIANVASTVPQIFGPAFAGVVVSLAGGYQPLFLLALVLAVLGSVAIVRVGGVR